MTKCLQKSNLLSPAAGLSSVCLCLRVCGYLLEDMLANDRLRLAGWLRS